MICYGKLVFSKEGSKSPEYIAKNCPGCWTKYEKCPEYQGVPIKTEPFKPITINLLKSKW